MCFFRTGVGNHQLTLSRFSSGFNLQELLCHTLADVAPSEMQSTLPFCTFACEGFVSATDS